MSELKFIHLTDTHILKTYEGSFLEGLDKVEANPTEQLKKVLQFAESKKDMLDFLIISGDLVHEGDLEDYEYYKSVLETYTKLPVYLALGNHDVTEYYWEAFHNKKDCNHELYYVEEFKGYRIIVLDSSFDKSGTGFISEDQLAWLTNILKTPSDNGSIIVVHHPIDEEQLFGEHSLTNTEQLLEALQSDDVVAVLSGHIHQNSIQNYPNFVSSAAEGTCFGVEFDGDKVNFTNNSAFNICTIKNRQLKIQVNRVPEMNQVLFSYGLDEMNRG